MFLLTILSNLLSIKQTKIAIYENLETLLEILLGKILWEFYDNSLPFLNYKPYAAIANIPDHKVKFQWNYDFIFHEEICFPALLL